MPNEKHLLIFIVILLSVIITFLSILAFHTEGNEEMKQIEKPVSVAEDLKKVEECTLNVDGLCISYIATGGNISWENANDTCISLGHRLPNKTEVKNGFNEFEKYFSNTGIEFVWTSERDGNYGWVEAVKQGMNSNWATAKSNQRNYVGYFCIK